MVKRLSELFDMPVFSAEGKYLGTVEDFVMDDSQGKLAAIIIAQKRKGAKRMTIPYELVKACADIYIVQV